MPSACAWGVAARAPNVSSTAPNQAPVVAESTTRLWICSPSHGPCVDVSQVKAQADPATAMNATRATASSEKVSTWRCCCASCCASRSSKRATKLGAGSAWGICSSSRSTPCHSIQSAARVGYCACQAANCSPSAVSSSPSSASDIIQKNSSSTAAGTSPGIALPGCCPTPCGSCIVGCIIAHLTFRFANLPGPTACAGCGRRKSPDAPPSSPPCAGRRAAPLHLGCARTAPSTAGGRETGGS